MSARTGVPSPLPRRAPRIRAGVSLIEVVVACTLLGLTFTALTALTARLQARNLSNSYAEQRTATFFEQVNRVESLPYDSLATYLTTDSALYGKGYYVWTYTVDPESVSTSGRAKYRKISLTVTPRKDPTHTQKATIRRAKSPFSNPLNK
jgi:Tfp pilus assembly protein PilV